MQKENTNTLSEVLKPSIWVQGSIRCTYLSFFDKKGSYLFSLQKKDALDNPVVYGTKIRRRSGNYNYVEVSLTDDAIRLINEKVKDNKRTAYFAQVLDKQRTVYVSEPNVFWTEMPQEVQEEIQEKITTEKKKSVSKLALLAGVALMFIGK